MPKNLQTNLQRKCLLHLVEKESEQEDEVGSPTEEVEHVENAHEDHKRAHSHVDRLHEGVLLAPADFFWNQLTLLLAHFCY